MAEEPDSGVFFPCDRCGEQKRFLFTIVEDGVSKNVCWDCIYELLAKNPPKRRDEQSFS